MTRRRDNAARELDFIGTDQMRRLLDCTFRLSACLVCIGVMISASALGQTGAPTLLPGQTATLLPDGRWLLAGGIGKSGPQNQAVIVDTTANTSTPLPNGMVRARAGHTATVLPQGAVLILGGVDAKGLVDTGELFDPATLQFGPLSVGAPSARAYHTATVLTEGQVLVAGGIANGN